MHCAVALFRPTVFSERAVVTQVTRLHSDEYAARTFQTEKRFTYSNDKYGRYIADLIVDEHRYINKQLVEKGHAGFLKL